MMYEYISTRITFLEKTMIKRTPIEIMLLLLSALSALLISPFIYFRYSTGEMVIAVMDAVIVTMLVLFFVFVYILSRSKSDNK